MEILVGHALFFFKCTHLQDLWDVQQLIRCSWQSATFYTRNCSFSGSACGRDVHAFFATMAALLLRYNDVQQYRTDPHITEHIFGLQTGDPDVARIMHAAFITQACVLECVSSKPLHKS